MERKKDARFVTNRGLLQTEHVINGDQWKEAHEVTETRIFGRIYRKMFSPTVVASVLRDPNHAVHVNCILLSKREYLASEVGNTFLGYVTVNPVHRMVISCL